MNITEEEHRKILINIASDVFKSGWMMEQLSKMSIDKMLMDDLCQDMLISIMEYPNDKMISAYQKGEHLYLIKKMISNQFCSNTSSFYYKYRKDVINVDVDDIIRKEDNRDEEENNF